MYKIHTFCFEQVINSSIFYDHLKLNLYVKWLWM